jgi:folate-binding protein YgfZ
MDAKSSDAALSQRVLTALLDDRAVVRMAGPDAHALLQNVVTLDMDEVDRHGSGYGALLTPQGKILWDFVLHRLPDGYAADVRNGEAEGFAKRLTLYRLRAKVEIGVAPELAVYARWRNNNRLESIADPTPNPSPQGGGEPPDDPRLAELGQRWIAPKGSVETNATTADWHRHRIALAIPEGGIDFVFGDAFPHDAAMDSLHGVAFEKGCYIGQEVVSRMRHRGTARRRMVALHAKESLPEPGTEIMAGEKPLGRMGSSADGKGIALVRLDRLKAALDEGLPIMVGTEQVEVSIPAWATYDWPATATAAAEG